MANDVSTVSETCRTLMETFDAADITNKLVQNQNVNVQTVRASGGANLDLFFLRVGENDGHHLVHHWERSSYAEFIAARFAS